MPHPRRFRFGIQLSNPPEGEDWASTARKAEDLGYSTLFLPDHFEDQLAPVPAMMAAAGATTDLRVGCLVFDNDYKHPVVLAKEIATIDLLSGGRVELGLGAGWMRSDYEAAGMTYDRPGVRIERMLEGLTIMKGLFADGPFSFDGDHYSISELDGLPKPAQRPSPPILIGGGGRKVLSIAATEADIVGVNPSLRAGLVGPEAAADATAEATDRKIEWVKQAAGDRFDELELTVLTLVGMVTDDRQGTVEALAGGFGITPEEALEVPHAMVGTVEEICDDLRRRRDRWGFSYIVVQGDAFEPMAPIIGELAGT